VSRRQILARYIHFTEVLAMHSAISDLGVDYNLLGTGYQSVLTAIHELTVRSKDIKYFLIQTRVSSFSTVFCLQEIYQRLSRAEHGCFYCVRRD
jgi:uncharacterized membrane protein